MELLDYGARRYDPQLGRFLSPDTIIPDPSNPQSFNRYAYVRNNPLRYTDPTGHYLFEDTPDDEYIWRWDKPEPLEDTQVRGDDWDSFIMWEETQDPPNIELPDNGTLSIGLGGSAFAGVGANGGVTFNFDWRGNFAVLWGGGGGGYAAAGAGFGLNIMATNAPTVYNLEGESVHFGGQVGEGAAIGGEWVVFKGQDDQIYHGVNIMGGARLHGPWPGELHATVEHDEILEVMGYEFAGNIPQYIIDNPLWIQESE